MLQKRLKELMQTHKLTTASLEKKTGLSRNAINNILTGSSANPSVHTLRQIAKALNVSIESMIADNISDIGYLKKEQHLALADVSKAVLTQIIAKELHLSLDNTLAIIKEVFTYTIKSSPPSVDTRFIDWVTDKYK